MVYRKNFDTWHPQKKSIDTRDDIPYFKEREVWYCRMGCNVGFEQDGKGEEFLRPVVIVKKYNQHLFLGMPLTSKTKAVPFYFGIGEVDNRAAMAILSQLRPFSSKRLVDKIETLHEPVFEAMKKAAADYLFGS